MITKRSIPTTVNGVTYRSKLEAAWAIYWTRLKLHFEYEPRRYAISFGGSGYLPDFWFPLPDIDGRENAGYLVEVKPTFPTAKEIEKIKQLSVETGHSCIIRFGKPGFTTFGTLKTAPGEPDLYVIPHIYETAGGKCFHYISYPEATCSSEWMIDNINVASCEDQLEDATRIAYENSPLNSPIYVC
jgi:hypothetical protein